LRLHSSSKCCFFQAEDGIRDFHVTGVQTCALPILFVGDQNSRELMRAEPCPRQPLLGCAQAEAAVHQQSGCAVFNQRGVSPTAEIGRASCRGRVWVTGVALTLLSKTEGQKE